MKEKAGLFSGAHHTRELVSYLASLSAADEGYAFHVVEAMQKAGLRGASVSAVEGRLLESLARLSGAKKAVETGSLYGYSAHWLARGLPEGSRLYFKGKACYEGEDPGDNVRARAMREFFHVLYDSDRFVSASVIPTGEGLALGIKC